MKQPVNWWTFVPTIITIVIASWLGTLSQNTKISEQGRDIANIKEEINKYQQSTDRKFDRIEGKVDDMQKALGRIEGYLEHYGREK